MPDPSPYREFDPFLRQINWRYPTAHDASRFYTALAVSLRHPDFRIRGMRSYFFKRAQAYPSLQRYHIADLREYVSFWLVRARAVQIFLALHDHKIKVVH